MNKPEEIQIESVIQIDVRRGVLDDAVVVVNHCRNGRWDSGQPELPVVVVVVYNTQSAAGSGHIGEYWFDVLPNGAVVSEQNVCRSIDIIPVFKRKSVSIRAVTHNRCLKRIGNPSVCDGLQLCDKASELHPLQVGLVDREPLVILMASQPRLTPSPLFRAALEL